MRRGELSQWYVRSDEKVERYSKPSKDIFESVSKVHVDAVVGLHPEHAIIIDEVAGNLKARIDAIEGKTTWTQVGDRLYGVVSQQTSLQDGPLTPDEVTKVARTVVGAYENVPAEVLAACAYQVMWSYVGNIAISGLI